MFFKCFSSFPFFLLAHFELFFLVTNLLYDFPVWDSAAFVMMSDGDLYLTFSLDFCLVAEGDFLLVPHPDDGGGVFVTLITGSSVAPIHLFFISWKNLTNDLFGSHCTYFFGGLSANDMLSVLSLTEK